MCQVLYVEVFIVEELARDDERAPLVANELLGLFGVPTDLEANELFLNVGDLDVYLGI